MSSTPSLLHTANPSITFCCMCIMVANSLHESIGTPVPFNTHIRPSLLLLRTAALLPTPPQHTADSPCKWSDTPRSPHCNRLKGIRHSDLFSCQSRESLRLLRGPMCHQHHQDSPSSAAEQRTKEHCTFLLHCNSVAVLLSCKCTMM